MMMRDVYELLFDSLLTGVVSAILFGAGWWIAEGADSYSARELVGLVIRIIGILAFVVALCLLLTAGYFYIHLLLFGVSHAAS
jgi:hypothetical protein